MRNVVAADRERVFTVRVQVLRQVDPPTRVAVGPAAEELPVQIEHRVAHRAIALEEHLAVMRHRDFPPPDFHLSSFDFHLQPVPADARHVEEGVTVGAVGVERRVHAPVVRDAHRAPGGVVERRLRPREVGRAGDVAALRTIEDAAHRLHREVRAGGRIVGLHELPPRLQRNLHRPAEGYRCHHRKKYRISHGAQSTKSRCRQQASAQATFVVVAKFSPRSCQGRGDGKGSSSGRPDAGRSCTAWRQPAA